MNILKTAFFEAVKHKWQLILFSFCFAANVFLFIYGLTAVNINNEIKMNEIADLSKDTVIIDRSMFLSYEAEVETLYQSVEYTTRNFISAGQNIKVDVISSDLLDIGIPVYQDASTGRFDIDLITYLYQDETNIGDITHPIIIDEITALRRFDRKNVVGEDMVVYINNNPITFQVYAVIKETRERLNQIELDSDVIVNDDVINEMGVCHAYILEDTYVDITLEMPVYDLMILKLEDEINQQEINELLELFDVDYNDYPYFIEINTYRIFLSQINFEYKNAVVSNLIIYAMVDIIFYANFLFIFNRKLQHKLETEPSSNHATSSKGSFVKYNLYYWFIHLLIGTIHGFVIAGITLYLIYPMEFLEFFSLFFMFLLMVTVVNMFISTMMIIPLSLTNYQNKSTH